MSDEIKAAFERKRRVEADKVAAATDLEHKIHAAMSAFDDHVLKVIRPALVQVATDAQAEGAKVTVVTDAGMPDSPGTTPVGRTSGSITLSLDGSQSDPGFVFAANVNSDGSVIVRMKGPGITTDRGRREGETVNTSATLDELTHDEVVRLATEATLAAYDPDLQPWS